MIRHLYLDKKVTANQLAKQVILDGVDARACEPLADYFEANKMTDKEKQDFYRAFNKQVLRVHKLMGEC